MKPDELYKIELNCLGEMIISHTRKEEEDFDLKMQLLAWQTALLMNSTGNYKKKIKPTDLYSPDESTAKEQENISGEDMLEIKKKLQEELLSTFADSNMSNI